MNNPFNLVKLTMPLPVWNFVTETEPVVPAVKRPKTISQQMRDILAPIPDDQWVVNTLVDLNGRRCAWGHLRAHFGVADKFGESLYDHPSQVQEFYDLMIKLVREERLQSYLWKC